MRTAEIIKHEWGVRVLTAMPAELHESGPFSTRKNAEMAAVAFAAKPSVVKVEIFTV